MDPKHRVIKGYPCTNERVSLSFIFSVFIRQGKNGKAELVLLDHGLYDYLTPNDREYLCNLYKSIIMRNEDEMERYSHLLGVKGKNDVYFKQMSSW